jgi:TPR repeat protein
MRRAVAMPALARAVCLAASLAAAGASAEEAAPSLTLPARVAIVIGNQDYDRIEDLPNAARDATDMANFLRLYGFEVFEGQNLDRREFEALLREALLNLPLGSEVVFFYAGHGLQVGERNFLLPTDAAFANPGDLAAYAITLDRVIASLAARASVHIVFVDACRSNPFPGVRLATDLAANLAETQTGFGPFESLLNSLVAFSSSPGQVAVDGPAGGNSPYTAALMNAIAATPDTDLPLILPQVRDVVMAATSGSQTPWESSTLAQPFHFGTVGDGTFLTAPVLASTDAVVRGTSPLALTVAPGFDRMVDIAPALFDLRAQTLQDAVVTGLPANGEVALLEGGRGLFYRPDLREVDAADLAAYLHRDRVTVETGPPGARELVTVDLELPADPCDLQAGDPLDLQGVGLYRLPNEIDVKAALAACQAAVDRAPDTPRFRHQLGRAQQAAGDFVAALDSYRAAGAAGHTRSLHAEADLLMTPHLNRDVFPIPLDQVRGIELLEQGIALGDPYAIHMRGQLLLKDGATPADRQRGFDLLDRSAELGHTYSMNELGIYFLTKDTDHYQPDRGMTYLRASLARNDIYGMHNLGFVALYGLDGNAPDYALAAQYLEQAAAGGHPKSPATLGRMVMRGQLGPVDTAKAVAYYDLGLARGDGWGGANAAGIILEGGVAGLSPGDAAARAAKAVLLPEDKAVEAAEAVLASLNRKALDAGLQIILNELGERLEVDGAAGPATLSILSARADAAGLVAGGDSPRDRLILAAQLYWQARPTRPDLY